ncbi:uncharacterized protein METZ01_LOCUS208114, partial [marine metagenome]
TRWCRLPTWSFQQTTCMTVLTTVSWLLTALLATPPSSGSST